MKQIFEDLIQRTVSPMSLGIGEGVYVVSAMGRVLSKGIVISVYHVDNAVHVRRADGSGDRVYSGDLYKFVPVTDDEPMTAVPSDIYPSLKRLPQDYDMVLLNRSMSEGFDLSSGVMLSSDGYSAVVGRGSLQYEWLVFGKGRGVILRESADSFEEAGQEASDALRKLEEKALGAKYKGDGLVRDSFVGKEEEGYTVGKAGDVKKGDDAKNKVEEPKDATDSSGNVDPSKLPDDIKDKIADQGIAAVDVEKIAATVADAAVESMKSMDIKRDVIFVRAVQIQAAVREILLANPTEVTEPEEGSKTKPKKAKAPKKSDDEDEGDSEEGK